MTARSSGSRPLRLPCAPAGRRIAPTFTRATLSAFFTRSIRSLFLGLRCAQIGSRHPLSLHEKPDHLRSRWRGEVATLLVRLLGTVDVAIISGGVWPQFEKQLLAFLPRDERLCLETGNSHR